MSKLYVLDIIISRKKECMHHMYVYHWQDTRTGSHEGFFAYTKRDYTGFNCVSISKYKLSIYI